MSNHLFIIHLFKVPACLDLNFSERCFTEEPGCTVLKNSTKYVRCCWCLVYHIQYDCIHLAIDTRLILNNHLINGLLTHKVKKKLVTTLFHFMHSALVTNQTNADTSLHPGLVALITCLIIAVILLLVVLGIKRLRRKSGPGVYKSYFFHLFLIAIGTLRNKNAIISIKPIINGKLHFKCWCLNSLCIIWNMLLLSL